MALPAPSSAVKETAQSEGEESLLSASRSGDCRAFQELYERYQVAIRELCGRTVGDFSKADDLVQETFLKAFAHIRGFREGKGLWPWLSTIARNVCIDELRAQYRQPVKVDLDEVDEGVLATPEDETFEEVFASQTRAQARGLLSEALRCLAPRERRILLLRELEGWCYEDIATADESSVDAVRNVAWRARRFLKEIMSAGASRMGLLVGGFTPWNSLRRILGRTSAHPAAGGSASCAPLGASLAHSLGGVALALVLTAGSPAAPARAGSPPAPAAPRYTAAWGDYEDLWTIEKGGSAAPREFEAAEEPVEPADEPFARAELPAASLVGSPLPSLSPTLRLDLVSVASLVELLEASTDPSQELIRQNTRILSV